MSLPMLVAFLLATAPQMQESVVPPPPRGTVPRPLAGAPMATANDNRVPAGQLVNGTLTLALDVVDAAYQPEGEHDPVVRALAFAEPGQAPSIPGPLLRAPLGTTVRLTLHNRSDTSVTIGGLRQSMPEAMDTIQLSAGATREVTFRLDAVGNFFYWGAKKGRSGWRARNWIDGQLSGALIVDAPGTRVDVAHERIFVITDWFYRVRSTPRTFEESLVFNGKAWPYNERLTFMQGDSVHFRIINAFGFEHPLHLHGFYFRVTRHGGDRADTAVSAARQPLENMRLVPAGGSISLSFVPSTPGNWVFHCHFASHVGDDVSLHGAPNSLTLPSSQGDHAVPEHDMPGGHTMRGLVIGMHITPAPGYVAPAAADRRRLDLLLQKRPNGFPVGGQTAYGFLLQTGTTVPARDSISIPGPVLELKRGQPVSIVVHNNMDEPSGVHWHGLEIESFPDGVPGFSGIGAKIMPPVPPGGTFAAEFTPPRSGTFPYHAHLHEMRQIGSGMYGAIIVSDTPRDTTRDHLVVAGGGGLPIFRKEFITPLLVNGSDFPVPMRMTVGETHRIRIVSVHADATLRFRFGTDSSVARWTALAKDGADLPPALRVAAPALANMGPGETADFTFVPRTVGRMTLEVWIDGGQRVELPVEITARSAAAKH